MWALRTSLPYALYLQLDQMRSQLGDAGSRWPLQHAACGLPISARGSRRRRLLLLLLAACSLLASRCTRGGLPVAFEPPLSTRSASPATSATSATSCLPASSFSLEAMGTRHHEPGRTTRTERLAVRRQALQAPLTPRRSRPQWQERLSWGGVCGGGEQDKPLCPDCVCPGPKGTDTSQAAKHFSSCSCASSSKRA